MNFEDDDDEDFLNDKKEEFKRIKNLEITKKAEEIVDLVFKICELIEPNDENQVLSDIKSFLKSDAVILPAKIFGAEATEYYDLKMENAAIIRKSAMEIRLNCTTLEMFGFKESAYLNLIRVEIDAFRELFVSWIENFNQQKYLGDLWNMFNPPGTSLDDVRKNLDNIY